MNQAYLDMLSELNACPEAIAFAENCDSPQAAWNACERSDRMEWLLNELDAWPKTARAEYNRVTKTARAEYDRLTKSTPTVPELP